MWLKQDLNLLTVEATEIKNNCYKLDKKKRKNSFNTDMINSNQQPPKFLMSHQSQRRHFKRNAAKTKHI